MIEELKPYAEYKESGLPWLGRCPKHWNVRRTKILFHERVQKGFPNEPLLAATQTKGVVKKEDYETRTVTAQKDLHLLKLVEVGDYVISLRSFQGGIEVAHCRGIISPAYTVLKPQKSATSGYYSHFFKAKPFIDSLSLFVTGIREGQNIDYERLSRAELPMPSEDEQAAIVRFLDHANRKIDGFIRAKRKLIGLLNEQKQAIIHRAVTGKDEVRMVKDENGNSSFILQPSTLPKKPSGIPWLGDIPKHWEIMRLKNACKIRGGFAFKTEWFRADGVPVIRMSNLRRGYLELTDAVRILENDCVAGFELKAGDILYGLSGSVGATGSLGNFAVVAAGDLPAQLNQRLARFRPDGHVLFVRFLVFLIQTSIFYDQVLAGTTGTAQFNVSTNDVGKVTFTLPSVTEQTAICDWLDGALAKPNELIARTEREIALMQEYRTRLTADLVTGKLDVREAAAKLPDLPADTSADEEVLEEIENEDIEA